MAEHLLNRAQVGASLEQVRGERMAEKMGVNAGGVQPRGLGEPAQDQEGPGACQWPAAGVEEQLRAVVPVEVRPAASQVARERLRRLATDRDDALLRSLAEATDEAAVDVDGDAIEPDRLADAQPRAVEKLDE